MRKTWLVLAGAAAVLLIAVVLLIPREPQGTDNVAAPPPPTTGPDGTALRLGLIPERDIFQQSKRYRPLANYLSARLGRRVELVTMNTYEAVLQDFTEKKIEGAFLGSLVATLAMDRLGAKVFVKPEYPGGISTYRGVIFVRESSPITSVEQLGGHSIAMVRATTAGNLFPVYLMARHGLLGRADSPTITWVGTHDDVALEVMEGHVDVGAIKDDRLDALLKEHPDWKVRELAVSEAVPNQALVLRADVAEEFGPKLAELLLKMDTDPVGREALSVLGAARFLPCSPEQYKAIYDMVEQLADAWDRIGIQGERPKPPATRPATQTQR
jgi:phosphonate transport system substrate-binding protein